MITDLSIRNFKSIKSLDPRCRRVNIFIGEPNTGKSNILESLGLLCGTAHGDIHRFVRFKTISNLFFDDIVDNPVEVSINRKGEKEKLKMTIGLEASGFQGVVARNDSKEVVFTAADYRNIRQGLQIASLRFVRCYHYSPIESFPEINPEYLIPPHGTNLFSVLKSRSELNRQVADMFHSYGLELVLRGQDHSIEVQRRVGSLLVSYPFSSVSDTLRRMVFHLAAIKSNKGSSIVLEEPECNSFPFYTQQLAETIGLDTANQYFISTHNPYFLLSLIEKTLSKDLGVFLTYLEDHETRVKMAGRKALGEMLNLEHDPFLGLRNIIQ